MNALATDQARRIADLIHTTPALAGLRAGLCIGASDDTPAAAMTATSVITDKDVLHKAPPDILLTNYKQHAREKLLEACNSCDESYLGIKASIMEGNEVISFNHAALMKGGSTIEAKEIIRLFKYF